LGHPSHPLPVQPFPKNVSADLTLRPSEVTEVLASLIITHYPKRTELRH